MREAGEVKEVDKVMTVREGRGERVEREGKDL
jgi:hypothetical protein